MLQMDGMALTRMVKQDRTYGAIPVLMLTTEDAEHERKHEFAAGAALI